MNSINLVSALLKGKWLIEPVFAINQGALIANIINQANTFSGSENKRTLAYAVSAKSINGAQYSYRDGFNNVPKNSVAVIRVSGTLMKEDQQCGPMGMEQIGKIFKQAENHPNIDATVLHVDSPGGTVDGTEVLANIVKSAKKPVVTFVDGQMCSGALWIGSSADEVIASTDTDEIGSVGVLIQFADMQPYWEKQGFRFHIVKASTSPEKIKVWEDLRSGNYDSYVKETLDPLDEKFMNVIRTNCPNVQDKHLTGKVFFARDVMGIFVNSIGTLEDAILRASELVPAKKDKTTFTRSLSKQATGSKRTINGSDKAFDTDCTDKVNWNLINSLSHNQSVDQNIYVAEKRTTIK